MKVFELLQTIKARPGMYLHAGHTDRRAQLKDLQTLLAGYQLAREMHGAELARDWDVLSLLRNRLRHEHGWSFNVLAIDAILARYGEERAWRFFWQEISVLEQRMLQVSAPVETGTK